MGCSKLLNPQSDQFYLTQTKEGLTCKKKMKPLGWWRNVQRKKMTKWKPGEAKREDVLAA